MFFELSFNFLLRIDFIGENIIFEDLNKINPKITMIIIIILILFLKIRLVIILFCGLIIFIGIMIIIISGIEFQIILAFDGVEGIEWVVMVIRIKSPPTYIKNNIIPIQGEFIIYERIIDRNKHEITSKEATISWLFNQIIIYIEANIIEINIIIFSIVNFNLWFTKSVL